MTNIKIFKDVEFGKVRTMSNAQVGGSSAARMCRGAGYAPNFSVTFAHWDLLFLSPFPIFADYLK